MMREQDAVIMRQTEHPHRQASDRAGDAVAIQIERCKVGRPDVLRHIHLHAIDDGEKILAQQIEFSNRRNVVPQSRRRTAPIQRVDIVTPLLKSCQPFRPRAIGIRDVIDLPAKAVDLKHRLALLARQNAHRRVKRTAGRGCSVTRAGCRRLKRHAPAAGFDTGRRPVARRVNSLATPPTLCMSSSIGPRCTVSLSGSRTFKRPTILSANAWITEISSPSRKSFTSALSNLLSWSSASAAPQAHAGIAAAAPKPVLVRGPRPKRRPPPAHR